MERPSHDSASSESQNAENNQSESLSEMVEKVYGTENEIRIERCPLDDWGLLTIHFKESSVTISKEAEKLSEQEKTDLISSLRTYRDKVRRGDKPETKGMGGAGSVYALDQNFLIKESTDLDSENDALQNSYGLQQEIDKDASFPDDIKLVHSVALVEPLFHRERSGGRKKYISRSFPYDTVYGNETDKRIAYVQAYVIMPFISDAITLEELLPSKRMESSQTQSILKKLTEEKLIESDDKEKVEEFIETQITRILKSVHKAQGDQPQYERTPLLDTSEKKRFGSY